MNDTYACTTARENHKGFPSDAGIEMVECIAWQDKKTVEFINTISFSTEQSEVKCKSKDGSNSMVACPSSVKKDNQYMGDVDIAGAKRQAHSCSRKSVKWWHRLFYFVIDVCIVNAHIL